MWGAIQHVVSLTLDVLEVYPKHYNSFTLMHFMQLQNVLEVYLAFDEDGSPMDTLSGGLAISGPDFFATYLRPKKHPNKVSKKLLFRFESSRHAISVSSYMREQRDIELVEGGTRAESMNTYADDQPSISQHLVCKPANRNITGKKLVCSKYTYTVHILLCTLSVYCTYCSLLSTVLSKVNSMIYCI